MHEQMWGFSVHLENDTGKLPPSWSSHEQAEIQFVNRGILDLYLGNRKYVIEPGDVVVIAPNRLHKTVSAGEGNFSLITITIQSNIRETFEKRGFPSDMAFLNGAANCPVLRMQAERQKWLAGLFRRLAEETSQKEALFSNCAFSLLELIIVELTRFFEGVLDTLSGEEPAFEQPDISRLIKNVIQYINHNFREDINLSRISQEFWLNPSYLSRQFKSNVGINITEFIAERRIYHAKTLLLSSDRNVAEIALESGFNNIPYFNMVFKNQVGMTPKQFQKAHRHEIMTVSSAFPEEKEP